MYAFTEKYPNFNGRIITKATIGFDDDKTIEVNAQWDCGATTSSISKELALELGLKPIRQSKTETTSDSMLSNIYDIGIFIPNSDIAVMVEACETPIIHKFGIDILIGMDVIKHGDFAISTYDGVTCFSFRYPSQGLIDFKEQEIEKQGN